MTKRHIGKKIALGFSLLSFIASGGCLVGFVLALQTLGFHHPVTSSVLACILFFASCGVVLYVISQPPRYLPVATLDNGASPPPAAESTQ